MQQETKIQGPPFCPLTNFEDDKQAVAAATTAAAQAAAAETAVHKKFSNS